MPGLRLVAFVELEDDQGSLHSEMTGGRVLNGP